MSADPIAKAVALFDAAHAAVPEARELVYVTRVASWVERLVAAPSDALRLAARAQHLERWAIPRATFPVGRSGYFAWRKAVQRRQGERVRTLLAEAACDAALAERVATLVAKAAPRGDADAQALEDAACLVFLESELEPFVGDHPDYDAAKLTDIVRKTWAKMSPAAQALASAIPLPDHLRAVVAVAVAS